MTRPYKPRKTGDWRRSYADSFFTSAQEHLDYALKFGQQCHMCGIETLNQPNDHLFPVTLGGITAVGNLAIACSSCNIGKSDKSPLAYVIERVNAKKPVRFATIDEYIKWLQSYMTPYRVNYPKQYSIAEKLVNDRKELRSSAREDYLRELVDHRWLVDHDLLTLRDMGIPPEYELYWKQIHMKHPELYFPRGATDPLGAYERNRWSNDPKWLKLIELTKNFNSRETRDSYFATAEAIFRDIENTSYDQTYKHWSNKHKGSSEDKEARAAILAALRCARPPRRTIMDMFKR